jgi:membrane-associated HD superfamily phosphohydrolase
MVAEVGTLFGMYVAAKTVSLAAEIPTQQYLEAVALLIMAAKFSVQTVLWLGDINNKAQMLASCIVNLLLALLATFRIDVILMFIANIGIAMTLPAWNALNFVGYLIKGFCDTVASAIQSIPSWVTIAEVIGDVIYFELSGWRFFQL